MRIKPKKKHKELIFCLKKITRLNTLTFFFSLLFKKICFFDSRVLRRAETDFSRVFPTLLIIISKFLFAICPATYRRESFVLFIYIPSCIVRENRERALALESRKNVEKSRGEMKEIWSQTCAHFLSHFEVFIFARWSNFYHRHQYTNECTKSFKIDSPKQHHVILKRVILSRRLFKWNTIATSSLMLPAFPDKDIKARDVIVNNGLQCAISNKFSHWS